MYLYDIIDITSIYGCVYIIILLKTIVKKVISTNFIYIFGIQWNILFATLLQSNWATLI